MFQGMPAETAPLAASATASSWSRRPSTARAGIAALAGLALLLLSACSSAPTDRGEVQGEKFQGGELLQSDSNRMATLSMKQNLESLFVIMDKLYRRNPTEWKKTATSRCTWLNWA